MPSFLLVFISLSPPHNNDKTVAVVKNDSAQTFHLQFGDLASNLAARHHLSFNYKICFNYSNLNLQHFNTPLFFSYISAI